MGFKLASALTHCHHTIFPCFQKIDSVYKPDDLNSSFHALVLHGGGDISPTLYKQKPIKRCHASTEPTDRDISEWELIERAVKLDIPVIGICRGAQMLCAFDGGYLIQHIDQHVGGNHLVQDTETLDQYSTTSCHHQMMVPKDGHKNLVIAHVPNDNITGIDENEKEIRIVDVPEIVYFPKIKAIGIQGHPEWMPNTPFVAYCSQLIKKYLLGV